MSVLLCLRHSPRLFLALITVVVLVSARGATAADYAAMTDGVWSNAAAWTPAGVPGASDNVYIGSGYPASASSAASIALSQNESAYTVTLGQASGDSGTLDLGNYNLAVGYYIVVGNSTGSTGNIIRGGSGSLTTAQFYVANGSAFTFGQPDVVGYLESYNGASATTATSGNVTGSAYVHSGSILTQGADMRLSDYLDLRDSGSTLDMGGHKLSAANNIFLGWYGSGAPTLANRGPLATESLYVANQSFNLAPADAVTNMYFSNVSGGTLASNTVSYLELDNGTKLTTTTTGNVTGSVYVNGGSVLTLGADMFLNNQFDLRDSGSTLDMGGHKLSSSNYIFLGWYGSGGPTLANRGPLATPYLYVGNQSFSLAPADAVANVYFSNVTGSTLANHSLNSLYLDNTALATTSGTWSAASLELDGGSPLTTSTTGNVTSSVYVHNGSMLTLGADMLLSSQLDLRDSGSTLDMGGRKLSAANEIFLGWYGSGAPTLVNRGPLATASLYVANQAFSLAPVDAVTNLYLYNVSGSTLANHSLSYLYLYNTPLVTTAGTWNVASLELDGGSPLSTSSTGNVTGSAYVHAGSKLTLGADMILSSQFDLRDSGSTLDMGGHTLNAANLIFLNWYGSGVSSLANRGPLVTANLYVANQTFSLAPADAVMNLYLSNVTGSTLANHSLSYLYLNNTPLVTTAGSWSVASLELDGGSPLSTSTTYNVTSSAYIHNGSKLTLGADMLLNNQLDLRDSGSTLDMGGHTLNAANNILLGWYGVGTPTLINRGPLATTNLYVADQPFSLASADTVTNLYLYNDSASTLGANTVSYLELNGGSQLTTTATGNVTGSAYVHAGSELTLGADMVLSGNFDLRDSGSMLDMGGHKLTAGSDVYLGWYDSSPVTVSHPGPIAANYLYIAGGSALSFPAPNSAVSSGIDLANSSTLTLQQPGGQFTGFTFQGSSSAALSINDTSVLQLSGGSNSGPSWIFRWQDPAAGTWESALKTLIAGGQIAVSSTAGYSVFDLEGYTYVATPSTLIWNGGGGDNHWSTAGNWSGTTPTAGHWLRFGPLTAGGHADNNNDLTAGSLFYGIFFDSAAPAYNLQGNAIQLSGDVLNQSGTNQTIGLNIELVPGNGAFEQGVFDTGAMQITDSGAISGVGMLVKTGSGTLTLSGSNSYSGGTEVLEGKLIIASSASLLDGSDLVVGAGAAAALAAPVVNAPTTATASVPTPVPEAGTLALLAAAMAGFCCHRLRRRGAMANSAAILFTPNGVQLRQS